MAGNGVTAAPVASAAPAGIPKTAKVAMLTGPKNIEVKEYPMPSVGDNDILVKVEGCGVCGTDVHEWKGDPFGIIPVTLGHEGTGEIVKIADVIDISGKFSTGNIGGLVFFALLIGSFLFFIYKSSIISDKRFS